MTVAGGLLQLVNVSSKATVPKAAEKTRRICLFCPTDAHRPGVQGHGPSPQPSSPNRRNFGMGKRLRCSLRYVPAPGGGPPTTVGWPFAWLEVSEDQVTVAAGRLVPFDAHDGRSRWRESPKSSQRSEE